MRNEFVILMLIMSFIYKFFIFLLLMKVIKVFEVKLYNYREARLFFAMNVCFSYARRMLL